ncbi:uncharacterized protein TA10225 [Theileria annulata]|uniref:Uncharacterized protein n=1 Tax=Theileria annulata TaxID=5874 RepID=Q4U8V1_THEAN|nr:uncharacterized protein TA10225 [Theileria annulata]CAI76752.1 hypothetical protein, conserved [Theileria annulata]|eukprot:XP_953377.1 hypothetical protein, conserved [Theileria annulata]
MSFVDTLLSTSRLVQRRVKLCTCAGLERHLLHELDSLSLKFNLVSRGKSYIDISTGLDTIWSIIQNSRICRQLYIHVLDPFDAENPKHFINRLNQADWGSFIPFSHKLPPPIIKVLATKSKLYHTGMVRNMVERVINSHCYRYKKMQGDELPSFMKNRGYVPLCPKITVDINNNNCQVLADASGDLSERPWNKLSMIDDRIVSSASSAVIQELITRDAFADRTTVWDPFCHNGSLLLELLSYLNGTKSFYSNFNHSLILNINKYVDEKFRAESPNYPLHNCANDLLAKLKDQNAVQQTETKATSGNVEIKFDCKHISDVPLDLNKCIILTNLYYGNKEMKAQYSNYFREFLKFIKSKSPQTPSVYVISPRSFKRISKLKWETLMVFNNNGIIVDLLKLLK